MNSANKNMAITFTFSDASEVYRRNEKNSKYLKPTINVGENIV